ncbi:hypothetical protein CBL_05103 [Carabus blaptoides fortunei]
MYKNASMKDTLRLAFFNANGVNRQKHEVTEFLKEHDLDVMLINETDPQTSDRLKFANYTIYRSDWQHGPGGGTAILIKRSLTNYEVHIQNLTNPEATAIEVEISNTRRLRLVAVYNPPDKNILPSDLELILDGTTPTIVGDNLNAKQRHWNCRVANSNGRRLEK